MTAVLLMGRYNFGEDSGSWKAYRVSIEWGWQEFLQGVEVQREDSGSSEQRGIGLVWNGDDREDSKTLVVVICGRTEQGFVYSL